MKRCKLVVPDAGPFNSLWVADRLDLLLKLDMQIVVVDVVYHEMTSDPSYQKDRDVKAFIEAHPGSFIIETTESGEAEIEKRRQGAKPKRNAGDIAITDFLTSDGGLRKYIRSDEPVLLLYEDSDMRIINKPPNLHILSTVGLLRGMERVGLLDSADAVIAEMTNPSKPGRRPTDNRVLTDLPDGVDEPAAIESAWEP